MFHLSASGVDGEEVVVLPILRRSDRPRNESPAAVGTDISQDLFYARCTERALERADARVQGIRRQRDVAMLTSRLEFKHRFLFLTAHSSGGHAYTLMNNARDAGTIWPIFAPSAGTFF